MVYFPSQAVILKIKVYVTNNVSKQLAPLKHWLKIIKAKRMKVRYAKLTN